MKENMRITEIVKLTSGDIENCVTYDLFILQFSNGQLRGTDAITYAVIHIQLINWMTRYFGGYIELDNPENFDNPRGTFNARIGPKNPIQINYVSGVDEKTRLTVLYPRAFNAGVDL